MIRLEQVSKRFQNHDGKWLDALLPLDLHIRQGEIFGLMGYSGAGKSTLLRLINLLERPDSGQIIVDGQNLSTMNAQSLRQARRNIGMVFQQFNLLSNRTVAKNIALPLEIAKLPQTEIDQRVAECLKIVSLTEHAQHYPAQLSGGQKQRVGIARALAPKPHVILADEPTSALDPATTKTILSCLKNINELFGVTIVVVTHEMSVIRRICDRTALLHHGKLLEVIDVKENRIEANSQIGKELIEEE